MTDGTRRTLPDWLKEKNMRPNQLMRAGAGVSTGVIRRWVQTGTMPLEVEANHRSLPIALALGVPPELLDVGPNYRGMTEAGHRFYLRTRGTDDRGWEAQIDGWKGPDDVPEGSTRIPLWERVKGPTAEASLDAFDQGLRDLIRANQSAENEDGATAAAP